jgi:transcription initiation factor IIE alpha subunit
MMKKVRAFQCKCGDFLFEILTEMDTNGEEKTYFRCSECGEDYQMNEVNHIEE